MQIKKTFSVIFSPRVLLSLLMLTGLGACNISPAVGNEPTDSADPSDGSDPGEPVEPGVAELEVASPTQPELIFSTVQDVASEAQRVTLSNIGTASLEVTALALGGADASSFTVSGAELPLTLEAGETQEISVTFLPDEAGTRSATLEVQSVESGSLSLNLYGLGSKGEQGSNEPTLHEVVTTLGYAVDVGGTDLEIGQIAGALGDEVMVPLFERASEAPVTLEIVARYGPEEVFPYGYFTLDASDPVLHDVGIIAAEDAQELLPPLADGSLSFDPGPGAFGIFGQASGVTQYTIDSLNTGIITHAMRVYPLKNREGQLVPNSYLIGLEEAENGDYQDVLMVLSNVVPAAISVP